MKTSARVRDPEQRIPFTAMAAALVALAALFLTTGSWVLGPVAVSLLAAWLFDTRLEANSNLIRVARYGMFVLVIWQSYQRFMNDAAGLGADALSAFTIGQLCAIELAIQAWLRRPTGGVRSPAVVLLSCVIMAAASYYFPDRNINYAPLLTPLYFLFLGLAFRSYSSSIHHRFLFWKHGLSLAGVLALAALMNMSVVQFRNQISQWGMSFLELKSPDTTGISISPQLGSSFRLRGTLTRMLHIENPPEDGLLYLRVAAFSDYEYGRWLPRIEGRATAAIQAYTFQPPDGPPRIRIQRLGEKQSLIFAPLETAGLYEANLNTYEWQGPLGPLSEGSVDETQVDFYEITIGKNTPLSHLLRGAPDAFWRQRYLAVPPDIDPRVRELAKQIGAHAKTDQQKVEAVESYLAANHHYSLIAHFHQGDKVSQFLLEKRDAHCEFFASAAVILLRCLGVPSRYVIGYMAHEPDGLNALVVRGRDAHAWTECLIGDKWQTIDATPGGGRPDGRAGPLPWTMKWRESFNRFFYTLRILLTRLQNMPVQVWLSVVGVLAVWIIWRMLIDRQKTLRATTFVYASRSAELARLAQRFEKHLAKRGAPCPPGVSWPEHLRRQDWQEALEFAHRYEAARFGAARVGADGAPVQELSKLLNDLEKQK